MPKHLIGAAWERAWLEKYERLKAFKDTHGHTLVPKRFDADKSLGSWVGDQRTLHHKNKLRKDRTRLLNKIGFVWAVPDATWLEQYERLKAFKETHGNTLVPQSYAADRSLGQWVKTQRSFFKKGKLQTDRKRLLNKIGFVWEPVNRTSTDDARWLEQYEKLKAYKATHGHTLVPKSYAADRSLGIWVNKQRAINQAGRLREDRKRLLNKIGFVWLAPKMIEPKDAQWLEQYKKLKEFKETHGHTLVPYGYSADRPLGKWVSTQRVLQKKGELRADRHCLLDDIGFSWVLPPSGFAAHPITNDALWVERYKELKIFIHTHGHARIPKKTHKQLSSWTRQQRYAQRSGKLREDRRQLLNEIDFPWDSMGSSKAETCSRKDSESDGDLAVDDGDRAGDDEKFGGSEEEMEPSVIDRPLGTRRRSKRLAGQKHRGFYNENGDEEALDHIDKKVKAEKEQDGTVKEERDAASHPAIKEEEGGAVAVKHDAQITDTGRTSKEEEVAGHTINDSKVDDVVLKEEEEEDKTAGICCDKAVKVEEGNCVPIKVEE